MMVRGIALLLATTVAASASAQSTATLLCYRTAVPKGWSPRTPSSSARLAEYVALGSDNAGVAEVVVYFFGKGQGGNVQANLTRWKGQFSTTDGSPVSDRRLSSSASATPS